MDFEKAKLNPAAVFKTPQEIVSSQELSRENLKSFSNGNRTRCRWKSRRKKACPARNPIWSSRFATLYTPSTIGRIPSTRAPAKLENRTAMSRDELSHSVQRFHPSSKLVQLVNNVPNILVGAWPRFFIGASVSMTKRLPTCVI